MLCRALLSLAPLVAACEGVPQEGAGGGSTEGNAIGQKLALFDYTASNTNSALDANTSKDYIIHLGTSETVMIGTCGINESAHNGDTYLRLYDPNGSRVASNDNGSSEGCGKGSKLSYTAPAAGDYLIRAGCYSSSSCSGTVALSRSKGAFNFSVDNTNSATINTYNKQLSFNAGDVVRISTCGNNAYGASATGDTYLRLFKNVSGLYSEVASGDNAVGCGTAAEIAYTISTSGYYQFRAGCFTNMNCSGTVAIYVE